MSPETDPASEVVRLGGGAISVIFGSRFNGFATVREMKYTSQQARNQGGGICSPRNFQNVADICGNFQRIKVKFYIPIIFKNLFGIFLCLAR